MSLSLVAYLACLMIKRTQEKQNGDGCQ
jgi:hypothetical protein